MKPTSIILLIFIALFTVGLAVNFSGNSSTYTTFAEAKKSQDRVHIVGKWTRKEESNYDTSNDIFTFYLEDTTGVAAKVAYHDPKPMDFEKAERVVIIGHFETPEIFDAEKIIMKCPSKYGEEEIKVEAK